MFNLTAFSGLHQHNSKRQRRMKQALDNNIQKIAGYLDQQDHRALKLICQSFYYHFVTVQIWTGLKLGIAEQKLEYYYDDLQFEQTEPKAISKKDKNIRIHSLKKQKTQQNTKDTLNKERPKRQASNIKEKGKMMTTVNNQLLFRNTQIGFKRLLKANPRKKTSLLASTVDFQYEDSEFSAIEIPKNFKITQYVINTKDPWSLNIHRAQNLIALVKKWNDFQHKIIQNIKKPAKDIAEIICNLKQVEERVTAYRSKFQQQPYTTVLSTIEGAHQNLLIDDQLNKVCKLFWQYHSSTMAISLELQPFIKVLQKDESSIKRVLKKFHEQGVELVEIFGVLDEGAENYLQASQKQSCLGKLVCPNILGVYCSLLQGQQSIKFEIEIENKLMKSSETKLITSLQSISWKNLVRCPNYFQILLQIMISFCSKLQKMISTYCTNQLTLSITINRIKNTKGIIQNLWNIAKYFNKLYKQVQAKKSTKKDNKIEAIREFFEFYEKTNQIELYLIKNPAKIEKDMLEFKENINSLKEKMQKV